MTNHWDVHMENTYLQLRDHVCQSSNPLRDYTSARCRSISGDNDHTNGFKYDDSIMSPLLRSEKPSAVHIIIGHTY